MICAKIRSQDLFNSGEEDFFMVFTIYGSMAAILGRDYFNNLSFLCPKEAPLEI